MRHKLSRFLFFIFVLMVMVLPLAGTSNDMHTATPGVYRLLLRIATRTTRLS
jgi:hypothetical protein